MNNSYKAFISYNIKDLKKAKKVQKRIESYNFPKRLRHDYSLPKKLRPIFLDKTDMGLGEIDESLAKKLDKSEFLIVICSPHAANSKWVEIEVSHFVKNGRADKIIPLIVEGSPDESEGKQCYPPSLNREALGASVLEMGYDKAFIRLVATMCGLEFDLLWQRHLRRQKKRKETASLVLYAFLLTALLIYDKQRIKERFYANYIEENLLPRGITVLSSNQKEKRSVYYKFHIQNNKVLRIEHYNAHGFLSLPKTPHELDRPAVLEFRYQNQVLVEIKHLNTNDKITKELKLNRQPNRVIYVLVQNQNNSAPLPGKIHPLFNDIYEPNKLLLNSSIDKYKVYLNPNGKVEKKVFIQSQNITDGRRSDFDGIYGISYKYDRKGRISKLIYLNKKGFPGPSNGGIQSMEFEYDEQDNIKSIKNQNKHEKLCFNSNGWAVANYRYDENGNVKEEFFLNKSNLLTSSAEGYARARYKYDKKGNKIEATYFGADNRPINTIGGYSSRKWTFSKDEKGYLWIGSRFFDFDKKPITHLEGYGKMMVVLNKNGNMIEQYYYSLNGSPYEFRNDFFRVEVKRDESGNPVLEKYFGKDNRLKNNRKGFAIVEREYDQNLMEPISEAYFDIDYDPCLSNLTCIHKWKSFYYFKVSGNYTRNLLAQAYFDERGCLTSGNLNYPLFEVKYNATTRHLDSVVYAKPNTAYSLLSKYQDLTKVQLDCKTDNLTK